MVDEGAKKLFKRLPQTVVPTQYDLTIQPFLDIFKFNGSVIIYLKFNLSTDTVVLHAADLHIDYATIALNAKDEFTGKIRMDPENERVEISFDNKLEACDYQLSLKFTGDISDRMTGFYRNKYTTPDGKEIRYGACT
ncbi:unnamed protein product [Rotaria socialis]|uniref:Aminopeptidase N-like N-terminal domain-containing protein n=1 Tax=Rotaria socialis TaxID=392032 RepID=A0A821SAN6_9BILA|nr:unnamed protein product [Rotaria socialis]CAF3326991.1 unnamed protein product [Rotaria socialis]CAF3407602.1 unnamed protein product [Rotaria socialis]CAF4509408.1 unnamed protein product [Rotaria socialis]CAF4639543.1 unnamed protein product [Rotaria socialis]